MYAVGRLGSYISGGLYTVSGPFHVFGGAVDIIVVEQPDGSFKSSPWYVRFGKFQGVLKAKEKIVNIGVNGVEANFHMHLDQRGQAYFLKEVEREEDSVLSSSSSSDEMDAQFEGNRIVKSKSCDFDATTSKADDKIDESSATIVARANSHKSRIVGLVFGQRSLRDGNYQGVKNGSPVARINSFERAEIAADLLEVQWSTNLATSKPRKDDTLLFSGSENLHGKGDEKTQPDDVQMSQVGPSVQDTLETSMNRCMLADQTVSCNVKSNKSRSSFESLACSGQMGSAQFCSSSSVEHIVETNTESPTVLEEKYETSDMSRNIDDPTAENADDDDSAGGFVSNGIATEARISNAIEASLSQAPEEDQPSDEGNIALTKFAKSEGESKSHQIQTFMHFETSGSSTIDPDGLSTHVHQNMHVACEVPTEPPCCPEILSETARQLLPQHITNLQAENIELEMKYVKACDDCSQRSPCSSSADGNDLLKPKVPVTANRIVTVDLASCEEVQSKNIRTVESFSISSDDVHEEIIGDSDSGLVKAMCTLSIESSEDEQFLFSDLDEHKVTEINWQSNLSDGVDKDNSSPFWLAGHGEVNVSSSINNEACLLLDQFFQDNQSDDLECITGSSHAASNPLGIPKVHDVAVGEVGWAAKSLPNMWPGNESLDADDFLCPLSHSLDSNSKTLEWRAQGTDEEVNTSSDSENENQSPLDHSNKDDAHILGGLEKGAVSPVGDSSKAIVASTRSWTLWPFSLQRSRSRKLTQPDVNDTESSPAEKESDTNIPAEKDTNQQNPELTKRMLKAKTPTSEQLASLNLKEGRNSVTFTFSTSMLGKQEVDARIYVWKWNTRIVISDVDGTITKSDVLGQFMPLVGVDWSQTGVAHLFSSIKENGYQLLFLSARAISQAYHTRQFLVNLKQDGKTLPDGPIVISPDGLFPSLFREVIRRAPHEFKIACLEDIKALFPSDRNPFYAGFGNRDTDEISYLKVGIPRGKIFIINPKGEVAVHRRVDKKSYTSLHALVHDMFPPATSSEQQEDFNSWNFWKLPPPNI
ncbi:hypothetical protein K2173_007504 [Erythroxylum novogranatense]|uniref:LNS2/PITP domain-containing protein n=1 Tax=Erythroxylum novogranatense TaxID=1862640 RepID=A0AAV8T7H5_9ROSI|nr:hypothetical protein K2173_007504 [Erythroxylum novogranatense]